MTIRLKVCVYFTYRTHTAQLSFDWVRIEPRGAYPCIYNMYYPTLIAVSVYSNFYGVYSNFRSGKVNTNGQELYLYTAHISSVHAVLYGLGILSPSSSRCMRVRGSVPGYGALPPLNTSHIVTP